MRCALRLSAAVRCLATASCLLAIVAGFAGCRGRETPVEAGLRTQTLHLALGAEPRDLDPHILVAYNDMLVALALFEGLTAIDEHTSQPVPAVAERWESSPDGLTWTFHLRAGLKWSDGTPLTAGDFVASWQRALSPKLGSEYAYVLFALKNAEAFNAGRTADFASVGARARDERTIEILLERPTPYLPALTALPAWFPVPRHVIVKLGALDDRANPWTRRDPVVSNGPFLLKEWRPNQRIVTVRNPQHYAAATTRLQSVVFYPMENAVAQEAAFRAGQLHLTYELPIAKIAAYREREPEKLRTDPFLETAFLRFNTTRPPFNDPRVRAAFARAIDRDALVEHVTRGGQKPAHALTPPGTGGYTPPAGIPDDVNAARELLASAGFPGGKGLPQIEVQFFTSELNQKLLEAIQEMWHRELGVRVLLAAKEQRVWLDDERQLNYTISYARWIGDYVDPSTFLEVFLSESGNNATGWKNADYDRLVTGATSEADDVARHAAYQKAEALLLTQTPIAPLYYGTRTYLLHPSVHGWPSALLGFYRYQNVWLE